MNLSIEYWSVWYPKAGATGLLLSRGLLDPTASLLLHAPGDVITVEIHDVQGRRLAYGRDLMRTKNSPICRLQRVDDQITRVDCWPSQSDLGSLVLLPGGEVGTLVAWWHADDHQEWRWQVEFYNTLRKRHHT